MSELLQVFASGNFKKRIFFLVLNDAKIYDSIDLLDYVKHWEDKKRELEAKIRSVGLSHLQGIRDDLDLYDDIRDMMPRIVDQLRDMIALSPQDLRDSDYAALVDMVRSSRPEASTPAEPPKPSPFQKRLRPAPPGASIGHHQAGATTFGALVVDRQDPEIQYILTDVTPFCVGGLTPNPGDGVIQPARLDGGTRADLVAKVSRFVLAHDRPEDAATNLLALIAKVRKQDSVCAEIPGAGFLRGVRSAVEGETVSMAGRTSGRVTGEILNTDAQIQLGLPVGCVEGPMRGTGDGKTVPIVFAGLIETTHSVLPGDCGALLLGTDGHALGMAFAGSQETSFFFPLQRVLDALEVDLVIQSRPPAEVLPQPSRGSENADAKFLQSLRAELASDHPERVLSACRKLVDRNLLGEAGKFLDRAIKLSRPARPDLEAQAYRLLGDLWSRQRGSKAGRVHWLRSQQIYRRLGDAEAVAEIEALYQESG